MLDFKDVHLEHKQWVEEYMRRYADPSCQNSFHSLYCLKQKYGTVLCFHHDFLFLSREHKNVDGYRAYMMPVGPGNPQEAIRLVLEDAHKRGMMAKFATVTEGSAAIINRIFPGNFDTVPDRDYFEYVYLSEKLANLPGSEFASKRQKVRRFWRDFGDRAVVKEITPNVIPEVATFQQRWLYQHNKRDDYRMLLEEDTAISVGLAHFRELALSGIILCIDGEIQGYAYGGKLADDTYNVYIEKCDIRLMNGYEILNMELIRRCAMSYTYINREEDVGIPGLRRAKLSYKPCMLVKKYILKEVKHD